MSLLHFDGFEWLYAENSTSGGWSSGLTGLASGRRGTYCGYTYAENVSSLRELGANYSTLIMGMAFSTDTNLPTLTRGIFGFSDAGTAQLLVAINPNLTLSVYRGTTLLATTTDPIRANTWYYLELKATLHNSAGAYELRVNKTTQLSDSGVDTTNTANAYANQIFVGAFGVVGGLTARALFYDDLYVCDDAGGVNNDFLGDVKITPIYPNADGTYSDFTPSHATPHYQLVDDATHGASDYNQSGTVGHKDSYEMSNISVTADDIIALQTLTTLVTDGGSMNAAPILISGATETETAQVAVTTSYAYHRRMFDVDPNTGSPWTHANLSAIEAGVVIKA